MVSGFSEIDLVTFQFAENTFRMVSGFSRNDYLDVSDCRKHVSHGFRFLKHNFFDFWFAANTLRIVCGFEISFTVVEVNFRTGEIKSFTVGKIRFTAGKVKRFTVGKISFRAKEVKSSPWVVLVSRRRNEFHGGRDESFQFGQKWFHGGSR